eukprot:TRINITY_DN15978_c0_g1_i1.p1 TRINITY_DN15978_c0_g1~~TRINITY_DN15978_c0_g1_i1.p1  ORF type:complete len:1481 (+),score=223.17 TRINITY_DN15978_c0_g1_i1:89-4531(+)
MAAPAPEPGALDAKVREEVRGQRPAPFGYSPRFVVKKVIATGVTRVLPNGKDWEVRLGIPGSYSGELRDTLRVHCVAIRDGGGDSASSLRFAPWRGTEDQGAVIQGRIGEGRWGTLPRPQRVDNERWWHDATALLQGAAGCTVTLKGTLGGDPRKGQPWLKGVALLVASARPIDTSTAVSCLVESLRNRVYKPKEGQESVELNLQDETGKAITQPVRGAACTHVDCFDLEDYVQHYHKKGRGACTVCGTPLLPRQLVTDSVVGRHLLKRGHFMAKVSVDAASFREWHEKNPPRTPGKGRRDDEPEAKRRRQASAGPADLVGPPHPRPAASAAHPRSPGCAGGEEGAVHETPGAKRRRRAEPGAAAVQRAPAAGPASSSPGRTTQLLASSGGSGSQDSAPPSDLDALHIAAGRLALDYTLDRLERKRRAAAAAAGAQPGAAAAVGAGCSPQQPQPGRGAAGAASVSPGSGSGVPHGTVEELRRLRTASPQAPPPRSASVKSAVPPRRPTAPAPPAAAAAPAAAASPGPAGAAGGPGVQRLGTPPRPPPADGACPELTSDEIWEMRQIGRERLCGAMVNGQRVGGFEAVQWWKQHYNGFIFRLRATATSQARLTPLPRMTKFSWANTGPLTTAWYQLCAATRRIAHLCNWGDDTDESAVFASMARAVQASNTIPSVALPLHKLEVKVKDFRKGGAYGGARDRYKVPESCSSIAAGTERGSLVGDAASRPRGRAAAASMPPPPPVVRRQQIAAPGPASARRPAAPEGDWDWEAQGAPAAAAPAAAAPAPASVPALQGTGWSERRRLPAPSPRLPSPPRLPSDCDAASDAAERSGSVDAVLLPTPPPPAAPAAPTFSLDAAPQDASPQADRQEVGGEGAAAGAAATAASAEARRHGPPRIAPCDGYAIADALAADIMQAVGGSHEAFVVPSLDIGHADGCSGGGSGGRRRSSARDQALAPPASAFAPPGCLPWEGDDDLDGDFHEHLDRPPPARGQGGARSAEMDTGAVYASTYELFRKDSEAGTLDRVHDSEPASSAPPKSQGSQCIDDRRSAPQVAGNSPGQGAGDAARAAQCSWGATGSPAGSVPLFGVHSQRSRVPPPGLEVCSPSDAAGEGSEKLFASGPQAAGRSSSGNRRFGSLGDSGKPADATQAPPSVGGDSRREQLCPRPGGGEQDGCDGEARGWSPPASPGPDEDDDDEGADLGPGDLPGSEAASQVSEEEGDDISADCGCGELVQASQRQPSPEERICAPLIPLYTGRVHEDDSPEEEWVPPRSPRSESRFQRTLCIERVCTGHTPEMVVERLQEACPGVRTTNTLLLKKNGKHDRTLTVFVEFACVDHADRVRAAFDRRVRFDQPPHSRWSLVPHDLMLAPRGDAGDDGALRRTVLIDIPPGQTLASVATAVHAYFPPDGELRCVVRCAAVVPGPDVPGQAVQRVASLELARTWQAEELLSSEAELWVEDGVLPPPRPAREPMALAHIIFD